MKKLNIVALLLVFHVTFGQSTEWQYLSGTGSDHTQGITNSIVF
ncbi:hypothetical protein [Chitinophaga oryziterrae]|nr:hypothetical protein [Chitinophaga oryziterrae]